MSDREPPEFGTPELGVIYRDRPGAYGLIRSSTGLIAVIETSYGLFLPGGGLEAGEDERAGLARELKEEINADLKSSHYIGRAVQYRYSRHYGEHFRKIGAFYRVELVLPFEARLQEGHILHWLERRSAEGELSEEFQRWALTQI